MNIRDPATMPHKIEDWEKSKLGFITVQDSNKFLKAQPSAPRTVEDTGLGLSFIADLVLKHILLIGDFRLSDVSESVKLPISMIDIVIEYLQRNKYAEVKAGGQYQRSSYTFTLTTFGRKKATELMEICRYVGPAPVTLEDYKAMLKAQTIENADLNPESLRAAFSNLVISEQMLRRLGPAIMSGKSFSYMAPQGQGRHPSPRRSGTPMTRPFTSRMQFLWEGKLSVFLTPLPTFP